MTDFKNEIVRFNQPKTRDFFPDTFSNEVYFSEVKDFHAFGYTSNFSIKYVINGYENYKVGSRNFTINDGQYLLVNDGQEVICGHAEAKAISIFLNNDLVYNVMDNLLYSEEHLLESPFENMENNLNFFENIYTHSDELGAFLKYFHHQQSHQRNFNINQELFYLIAERLLLAQTKVQKSINRIDSVKYSTRCELFRRALISKTFIEENLIENFSLDLVAAHCGLSKYHLLRTFKSIYGTTPYNYYLYLKIEKSKPLLKKSTLSVTEIAEISGFNDIHSYCKRFKVLNQMTPLQYRNVG
ncbi:MAG: AraC family transcriptional regulator [Bacteroidota bacterium]